MSRASPAGGWRGRRLNAVARGLGWFSLGLGLAEIMLPRRLAQAAGIEDKDELLQVYGVREIATGVGILGGRDPAPWLWARVGGDALDLATLGATLPGSRPPKTGMAMAAVLGIAALDFFCARALRRESRAQQALVRDYSRRSGFPRPPEQMRGAARAELAAPDEMRQRWGMPAGHSA